MRLTVFIITAAIQLLVAILGFFVLLLGLNGYSERDSTPSLALYLVFGVITVAGTGTAGAFVAKSLVRSNRLGKVASATSTIIGFSILGVVILFLALILAISLAEAIRKMRLGG